MKKTTLLRRHLREEQLIIAPGAFDAVSAKIIENAGFKAIFLGGFALSASLLGKPDVGLLTMTELVTHAANIADSVTTPILVDAEAGYGGIANIQRTVRELSRAGVAGLFIEDQLHPVKCGTIRKHKRIVPMEEMIMRLRAALDARDDSDFIIAARTDSDIISLDEQIRRCNAYANEGADLVMPLLRTRDDFRIVAREIEAPLWLIVGRWSDLTHQDLQEMGVRGIITYPVEPLFVAAKAVMALMDELSKKGTIQETFDGTQALDFSNFFRLMGLSEIIAYEEKLMKSVGQQSDSDSSASII